MLVVRDVIPAVELKAADHGRDGGLTRRLAVDNAVPLQYKWYTVALRRNLGNRGTRG